MKSILIKKDLTELSEAAATLFVELAQDSIGSSGQFAVSLAGGSTPSHLYKLLASSRFRTSIDWKRVFFFFGDERNVPEDHPESNYRMVKEALFDALPLNGDSVRPWPVLLELPEKIAGEYELEIRRFFGGVPGFDLILLGLGSDVHTASLFPHTKALHEAERFAVANWVEKLNAYRLTTTFPVINNARNVVFLVAGEEKAEAVARVLEGNRLPDDFPAQRVDPQSGTLRWLLDEEAASRLRSR